MTNIVQNLENLILASSLAERSRPATCALILQPKSFRDLFSRRWNDAELDREAQAAVERMTAQGLLDVAKNKSLHPTASGKERAQLFLTPRRTAKKFSWAAPSKITIFRGYLPAKALGISGELDDAALRRLQKVDYLRAEILRRRFALDFSPVPPLTNVIQDLAWQLLARGASRKVIDAAPTGKSTFIKAGTRILNVLLCSAADRDFHENGTATLAAASVNIDDLGDDALYLELGRHAVEGHTFPFETMKAGSTPNPSRDLDDSRFAEEVRRIAESIDDGRVEDQLVFVSHVWRRLADEGIAIPLDRFKQRLVDAYRADRISLAKADMPQTLNPRDLDESEIIDRNTIFSFIRI
jgi:hypothetical protein